MTFVRNVTDIDDKVLANATADEPWWALAYRMEREFTAAYEAIGILPPTYEPRATASVAQMQELIAELIERGHAYAAAGDVYFDVRSWPEYGALTRQSLDAMEDAADADPRGKRDPHDFALWKGAKPDEPSSATWQSPWGEGRPGWHIECSAMSRRYLGEEFDIHGGGLDLRFPHHENELAQSAAAGHGFAEYWVHNGLVTVEGQKMAKSLGNFTLASDLLDERRPTSCDTRSPRRTTVRTSTSPIRRSTRRRQRSIASGASRTARSVRSAPRHPGRCLPNSRRLSTTISASRRASPRCTSR